MRLNCKVCKKQFYISPSRIGKRTHCSRKCYVITFTQFMKGNTFNKGRKRMEKNLGIYAEKGKIKGENSPMWKGNNVGYDALHRWVYREIGGPKVCLKCSSTNKLQWANKSGEYRRELNDWMPLCQSCHRKYDIALGLGKSLKKFPERKLYA